MFKFLKKTIIIVSLILILGLITSCHYGNSEISASDNNFIVAVKNNCDMEIYGIHYEYYIAQKPIGGGSVEIANGSPYKKGELMSCEFLVEWFPENADLSLFEIEIFVLLGNDREQFVGEVVSINAEYGNVYHLSLTGDSVNGININRTGR